MTISKKTLQALVDAECLMAEMNFKPCLAVLYCYFGSIEEAPTSKNEAGKVTKINSRRLSNNFTVLESMGFISTIPSGNQIIVSTNDLYTSLCIDDLSSLLLSLNIVVNTNRDKSITTTQVEAGQFSEADIKNDPDWKKVEPILLKHFKPFQINPMHLTKKKRFETLCELLSDKTFDFEAFCKWFRVEKYPQTKFNYGLFLYPGVIEEFRESLEGDSYLKTTTNLEESESHKRGVEDTRKFIAGLGKNAET